jgi:hypothetical protein
MKKRKKLDFVQFKIRLRESLRKQLEVAAHAKDVSLNSEMVSRLEHSFIQDSLDRQIAVMGRVLKVMDRIGDMIDRDWEGLERVTALSKELGKTEDQLREMILRAALGREPTDEERAATLARLRSGRAETNEERQARLRASADRLLENAERSDARSAHDLDEPREWDTRARGNPRRRALKRPDQEPELPMPRQKGSSK